MNLIENSSFESPYIVHANEVKVAHGWLPFYSLGIAPEGGEHCYRPEYKAASVEHLRTRTGHHAQCWFVRWKVMDAGVYQTVQVPVGALMEAKAHFHGWCSQSDDPTKCDGELYFRLGLDLQGGADPWNPLIVWSRWERVTNQYQPLTISAIADAPYCTVFLRAWNKWKLSHNDIYLDDVTLTVEGGEVPPGDYVCRAEFDELAADVDRLKEQLAAGFVAIAECIEG